MTEIENRMIWSVANLQSRERTESSAQSNFSYPDQVVSSVEYLMSRPNRTIGARGVKGREFQPFLSMVCQNPVGEGMEEDAIKSEQKQALSVLG